MARIAAAPVMFKAKFSVGTDEYTAHLSQVEFQPTQPTGSFTDISGETTNFGGKSSWQLALAGTQDWATANSLSLFLNENDGEDATVTLEVPGGEWEATVVCAAVNVGGSFGNPAAFQKTLQVKGTPEFTPAA